MGENPGPVNGSFSCPSSVDFRPCQATSQESEREEDSMGRRGVFLLLLQNCSILLAAQETQNTEERPLKVSCLFHLFTVFTVNMCPSRNIVSSRHRKHR